MARKKSTVHVFHEPGWIRADAPQLFVAAAPEDEESPPLFFNRELSWLDYCWRVLAQALDPRWPLLERVRFLSYTASHVDEFFSKRVGGLKRQQFAGVRSISPDGATPRRQLKLIRAASERLYEAMNVAWEQVLKPALAREAGLHVVDYADLDARQKENLRAYFRRHIFPILTPLAVDPGHPFPFISNLSLSLAVTLRSPKRGVQRFARMKAPRERGRWIPLGTGRHYVALEQVLTHNLSDLFRGMEVLSAHPFRVTRNADISRDEEEADDLISVISLELRQRRFAPVVRLEVERAMPHSVRRLLMRQLALTKDDLYEADLLIDPSDFQALADLDLPEHHFRAFAPVVPAALGAEPDMFAAIRRQDILVHHPYESFDHSVLRFIEAAASDPKVQAIKQTFYRISEDSPIMAALIRASEAGKQVAALVEVKARYDERRNITWGQRLEKSGGHVTFGLVGLKTHAKATLVLRADDDALRTYCHIGTGNYNADTARRYVDVGLFTCDADIGADLVQLFHYLTGYARTQEYRKILVAPHGMRASFMRMIHREIGAKRAGGKAHIMAAMNGLDDIAMIQELYAAAQAGVEIDLIVRGHCRLRPGLMGQGIRVVSIVGRFLEDLRVFYFENGGDPQVYLGSADWMRRNLDDRVEVVVPVASPRLKERLGGLLRQALADRRLAWDLRVDGRYVQRPSSADGLHHRLLRDASP